LTDEGLKHVEQALLLADSVKHPFQELVSMVPKTGGSKKARRPREKSKYVPSWYRGEEAAYLNAKAAMQGVNKLPKMG